MTSLRGVGSVTQLQLWTWRCDGLRFEKYARSQPKCSTDRACLSPSFLPSFLVAHQTQEITHPKYDECTCTRKLPGNPWIRCLLESINRARPNTNKWRRHGNWKWLCVRRQCMHVSFLPHMTETLYGFKNLATLFLSQFHNNWPKSTGSVKGIDWTDKAEME